MSRRLAPALALAAVLALLVAGCGGGSDSSTASTTATGASGVAGATGEGGPTGAGVDVSFEQPTGGQDNQLGATLLKANRVPFLMTSFSNAFQLPKPLLVRGVNGFGGGPFFNPKDNSITYQYGFVTLVYNTITQLHPDWTPKQVGSAVGAVDSFILAHEFTHALIHDFKLPVLGREEDAADDLATLILIKADGGDQYVADAAQFWAALSQRQAVPQVTDYADVHSLDLQRSFEMLCELAGSSKTAFAEVQSLNALPAARLATCPAEYKQKVKSFEQVLEPHVEGPLNLSAG
ncbi:MAG: hypothetical protein QOI10_1016 [Solirubrobacterales bacterium]|jgi:hypothetical protein|nr:hypothetical protein [Solirubrobacterales bacterium]